MMKRLSYAFLISVILAAFALPALAAPPGYQGGGGFHVGPYTLSTGDTFTGDLTVFGPVTLMEDSELTGNLTVGGELIVEEDAHITGEVVVAGNTTIAGTVDGALFCGGSLTLLESAYVSGDVSIVGKLNQEEGAEIGGAITTMEEGEFEFEWPEPGEFPYPIEVPSPDGVSAPTFRNDGPPFFVRLVWGIVQAIVGTVVIGVLALIIISLWPQQTERVGHAIEEAPLTSFAIGLLIFVLAPLVAILLSITVCLAPFAFVGMIIIGIGMLLGWVAMGLSLGRRVLTGFFKLPQPSPALSTLVGTVFLTIIMILSGMFFPLRLLFIFVLLSPAAGAVLLTRFGAMPYATHGHTPVSPSVISLPSMPMAPFGPSAPPEAVDLNAPDAAEGDVVEERTSGTTPPPAVDIVENVAANPEPEGDAAPDAGDDAAAHVNPFDDPDSEA